MCIQRDKDNLREIKHTWVIDLTLEDDLDVIEDSFENPINEQWNYPYNLLPSSDEEEPPREIIIIDLVENSIEDHTESETTTNEPLNEVNQNVNVEGTSGQLNERQEFEVDVPLVLLSMSRISNNLLERAAASRN